jgi:acetyl esterase/lipase
MVFHTRAVSRWLALMVAVVLALPLWSVQAQADPTPTYADVPYMPDGDRGQRKQILDIYLPEDLAGPYPTIFMIHCSGCTKWEYKPQAARFLEQGYATVSIEFRDSTPAAPLGPLEDSFCALAWVHANAEEYNLDPARIVVFGHSLGGYPAAMIGTVDDASRFMTACPHPIPEDDWTQGVVIYAGALLLPANPSFADMIGLERDQAADIITTLENMPPSDWRTSEELSDAARDVAQLFPHYWIDGSEPPTLLFHGLIDNKISPDVSEDFATLLEEAGVDTELMLIPGAGHGVRLYQQIPSPEVDAAMEAFLAGVFGENIAE